MADGGFGDAQMELSFFADDQGTHQLTVTSNGAGLPPHDLAFVDARSASLGVHPDAAVVWSLQPLTTTPYADRVTSDRLIDVYAYRPLDMRAMLDFDRRTSDTYAELCAVNGEFYAGPFGCEVLGVDWIVEVATYSADEPAAVDRLLAEAVEPDELRAIVNECRELQNRQASRYSLRLVPATSQH